MAAYISAPTPCTSSDTLYSSAQTPLPASTDLFQPKYTNQYLLYVCIEPQHGKKTYLMSMRTIRPISNPHKPSISPHLRQRCMLRQSLTTIKLHTLINNPSRHIQGLESCSAQSHICLLCCHGYPSCLPHSRPRDVLGRSRASFVRCVRYSNQTRR